MPITSERKQVIKDIVEAASMIAAGFEKALAADYHYDALDLGGSGGGAIVDGDFTDEALGTTGVTKQEFIDAVAAIRQLRTGSPSSTNLNAVDTTIYKIVKR